MLLESVGTVSLRSGVYKYIPPLAPDASLPGWLSAKDIEMGFEPVPQSYDSGVDPAEQKNIYLEQPDVVTQLSDRLQRHHREHLLMASGDKGISYPVRFAGRGPGECRRQAPGGRYSAGWLPDGPRGRKHGEGLATHRWPGYAEIVSGWSAWRQRATLEITIFGGIDINRTSLAPLSSIVPETSVFSLPFLFRSTQHMRNVLDGPIGEEILASLKPHGLIGLAFYDAGARSMYNTKGPD